MYTEFLTIGNPSSDGCIFEWLQEERRDNEGGLNKDNEATSIGETICKKN